MKKEYFLLGLLLYAISVLYLAMTTPISPHEAKILYTSQDLIGTLMRWGESLVSGVIGLRLFFLISGFITAWLFYELSYRYFSEERDAFLSTFIFMFLPGILTATTLVNVAIIVLPLVLLFVLLYEKGYFKILPFIMLILFFIHEASIIFFVAVLLYAVSNKDKKLIIMASTFLLAFIYLAKGIEIGGRPSGHFAEVFGLYATVFSPLLFLYFFYTMYRILLREEKTLLWYISFTALAFSLLLSIRQRVYITDFAPYVLISIILMLDIFNHSIRVRLPEFKKYYRWGFNTVITFLFLSVSVIVFHKTLFYISNNPNKHFAHRIYNPYLLAKSLKEQGFTCNEHIKGKESYQLQYYGLPPCLKKK